jgi:hypothetical protein
MGFVEIAGRGRQEMSKWLERAGLAGSPRRLDPRTVAHAVLLEPSRAKAPVRFFDGATSAMTPALLSARMPGVSERTLLEAEQILKGRFDLLGQRDLHFGQPIDWHLDPISGRRAPLVHWSRLDPLDPLDGGDCKLVWELNRHQWMVRLGQAYRISGDERYSATFTRYLRDWMETNPPGIGVNWASSLEIGLRLISWCWAWHLFSESRFMDSHLRSRLMVWIAAHAGHVSRHLSTYFSPNTHLTGEALALFYAGTLLPELKQAHRWRSTGFQILTEQILRQVLPDGVYFEQSTCYQKYTLEIYLHLLILAERNRQAVPSHVVERVGRMLDFLLAIRRPDGSVPQIGDSDGGRLLPLSCDRSRDDNALFSTAAALLGREDCARAAGSLSPETLWLSGSGGLSAFDSLDRSSPEGIGSKLFPQGGYAVMSAGDDNRRHQLIFDVGPLGCPVTAGHGHSDLLGIQCSVFDVPCLVDPGTFCYTVEPQWRKHFREGAAHCTVTVDGESQARAAGPFSWHERPAARLRRWISRDDCDLADAEHDAYGRLPDPVIHRRRVLFVKPRFWMVVDDLHGTLEHKVEISLQFAPLHKVLLDRHPWIAARGPSGQGLVVAAFATFPLETSLLEGSLNPIGGWVSPDHRTRIAAPLLRYGGGARLPVRIATWLVPVEHAEAPPPRVAPLMATGPRLDGFAIDGGREFVLIDDQDIRLERG